MSETEIDYDGMTAALQDFVNYDLATEDDNLEESEPLPAAIHALIQALLHPQKEETKPTTPTPVIAQGDGSFRQENCLFNMFFGSEKRYYPDFNGMSRAIVEYLNSKKSTGTTGTYTGGSDSAADTSGVAIGQLTADGVLIGNKTYQGDKVTDMAYAIGDYVYCLVPNSGQSVAIVGKL